MAAPAESGARGSESRLRAALAERSSSRREYLTRIPIRDGASLTLVPTALVAMIVAHGEKLTITTLDHQRHSLLYRLKDLEARLDPAEFVRLGRGALANLNAVSRIVAGPSGRKKVILKNGDELAMSRIEAQRLRRIVQGLLG
jgi:two-component system LytT family response regulator